MEVKVERIMNNLPKKLCSLLKSQSGFSLAELMVAAGVTGTLALGTLQLASLQTKANLTDGLVSAQQSVQLIMKNDDICKKTLANIDVSAPMPINIPNGISNTKTTNKCAADGTDCAFRVSPGASAIAANDESAVTKTDQFIVFGDSVMVEKISLTKFTALKAKKAQERAALGSTTQSKGAVEMEVIFAVKDTTRPAGQKIRKVSKYIYIPVAVNDANFIVDCNQPQNQGVLDAEFELCDAMGGSYADGKCNNSELALINDLRKEMCENKVQGSYDAVHGSCVPRWYGCKCDAPGDYIINFSTNNTPVCKLGGAPTCL